MTEIPQRTPVVFSVHSDADATRIANLLESLNYDSTREPREASKLEWTIDRLCRRYRLRPKASEAVGGVLRGRNNRVIAKDMGVDVSTVARWLREAFEATGCRCREDLLRLAVLT